MKNENIITEQNNKPKLIDVILFEPFKNELLQESINNPTGKFLVEGVLQRAGAKNQNGRVYPKPILEREAEKYINTRIAEKRAFGELDHPDSAQISGQTTSHTVEKLYWKGDDLCGIIEVLDTPCGNIVKNILKAGKTLGISSRGAGSVKSINEDTVEVNEDFDLICWDFVTDPSTHGAFMRPISESNKGITKDKYFKINEVVMDILKGI